MSSSVTRRLTSAIAIAAASLLLITPGHAQQTPMAKSNDPHTSPDDHNAYYCRSLRLEYPYAPTCPEPWVTVDSAENSGEYHPLISCGSGGCFPTEDSVASRAAAAKANAENVGEVEAQQPGANMAPPTANSSACGSATQPCAITGPPNANGTLLKDATPDFRAKAEANMERLQQESQRRSDCVQYKVFAMQVSGLKASGASFEFTSNWASARAYGPNGEVFRTSADTEDVLLGVVRAAYFGNGLYGSTPGEFVDYAYKLCLSGSVF